MPKKLRSQHANGQTQTAQPSGDAFVSSSPTRKSDFEKFVMQGITDIKAKLASFEGALEYQANFMTDLERRFTPVEGKVDVLEKKIEDLKAMIRKGEEAENKLERFSRRNNFRIIGLPQESNENSMIKAKQVLEEKFGMNLPRIERAHRDGRGIPGKPRHMLVKMLSFQDKREIMFKQRDQLKAEKFYITDDLTKKDLEAKKMWKAQVQESYEAGKRLHFAAGKWRTKQGNLADFYEQPGRTGAAVTSSVAMSPATASTSSIATSRIASPPVAHLVPSSASAIPMIPDSDSDSN